MERYEETTKHSARRFWRFLYFHVMSVITWKRENSQTFYESKIKKNVFQKMYSLQRCYETCTIGIWGYGQAGKPTGDSKKKWLERCNFVFAVTAKVCSIDSCFDEPDMHSGWILYVQQKFGESRYLYLRNDHAASHGKLRKFFLKSMPGSICRMTNDDFWAFVGKDVGKEIYLYVM